MLVSRWVRRLWWPELSRVAQAMIRIAQCANSVYRWSAALVTFSPEAERLALALREGLRRIWIDRSAALGTELLADSLTPSTLDRLENQNILFFLIMDGRNSVLDGLYNVVAYLGNFVSGARLGADPWRPIYRRSARSTSRSAFG
jgi:hypothetical protein